MPRLGVHAGFELGTGVLVNPVAPETAAARRLRDRVNLLVGITIAAPPAEVWRVIEPIEHHVDWMADAESITFTSATHAASARASTASPGSVRCTPPTAWTSPNGSPASRWASSTRASSPGRGRFTLEPGRRGRTRFTWTEELTFPWWMGGAAGAFAAKPVLRAVWQRNLRTLKHSSNDAGQSPAFLVSGARDELRDERGRDPDARHRPDPRRRARSRRARLRRRRGSRRRTRPRRCRCSARSARPRPHLGLGTGVLALQLRTPPLHAMAAATLQQLAGDRDVYLGVGISSPAVAGQWHGAGYTDRPIAQVREFVTLAARVPRRRERSRSRATSTR